MRTIPDSKASITDRAVEEHHWQTYRNLYSATGGTMCEWRVTSPHPSNNQHEQPKQQSSLWKTSYNKVWRGMVVLRHCLHVQPNSHNINLVKQWVLRVQSTASAEQALLYQWCKLDMNNVSRQYFLFAFPIPEHTWVLPFLEILDMEFS